MLYDYIHGYIAVNLYRSTICCSFAYWQWPI